VNYVRITNSDYRLQLPFTCQITWTRNTLWYDDVCAN